MSAHAIAAQIALHRRPSAFFAALDAVDVDIDWRERAERAETRAQELEAEVAELRGVR